MATSAVSSHGTLLKIGDGGGSEVFTTIGEVLDISGPSYELSTEEVTNHDSSGWREFIPTLLDVGEITFDINYYSATTQDQIETDHRAKTKRNFKLVFPLPASGTDTRAFSAYITGVEFSAPVEGVLKGSITLRPTGADTKTVA